MVEDGARSLRWEKVPAEQAVGGARCGERDAGHWPGAGANAAAGPRGARPMGLPANRTSLSTSSLRGQWEWRALEAFRIPGHVSYFHTYSGMISSVVRYCPSLFVNGIVVYIHLL